MHGRLSMLTECWLFERACVNMTWVKDSWTALKMGSEVRQAVYQLRNSEQ